MYIIINGQQLEVPVLPPELKVKSPGANEKATVLQLGEINILRQPGLRLVSWESFLPAHPAPFASGSLPTPITWIKAIQAARDSKENGRFLITGTDLDVNMPIAVEEINYREKAGEAGDIYYSITLKEYKPYAAARVSVSSGGRVIKEKPKRAGSPPKQKTYTVKAGDSLWAIAQQVYGDGSRYPELYSKNKNTVDSGNRGTGNPKYTIYPGQTFQV